MKIVSQKIISWLRNHEEPDVRYKTHILLLEENPDSLSAHKIQDEIRQSSRVQMLLSERDETGRIPLHPYYKWSGAHWVLTSLAELNYPPGDLSLLPLWDQVFAWLFSQKHQQSIKTIDGLTRRCASQEANAIFSSLSLGLQDEHTHLLAKKLLKWQWSDGGWNCDKKPAAKNSSFWETITPLRALILYAAHTGSDKIHAAVASAAEIFLKRQIYKKQSTGELMQPQFVQLHYPTYWRYDILIGLKTMADAGFIGDPRCTDALDELESKMLFDGGFPAEAKFYQTTQQSISGYSKVNWGGVSGKKANPWISVHALYVLKKAGRMQI